jgi:putative transcriptional regulator
LLAAFFILLPSGFKVFFGHEGEVFLKSPLSNDPIFGKTVLYMMNHSIDGASALVINQLYPQDKMHLLPPYIQSRNFPIYWGGPVEDTSQIIILKVRGEKRPLVELFDDAVKKNPNILETIEKNEDGYRVYIGYAGWQALQFELENLADVWIFGAQRTKTFQEILRIVPFESEAIWLKVLERSDFYKRPLLSRRDTA